ncbi:beta-1,4-galactosyltransferase 5-like [Diadema antillarum]|uniref:beta-1,4-galactosyltransferase 5-like n=1 Tax=Diadema antillarum TaxID=105358 RepID=UPI003A882028
MALFRPRRPTTFVTLYVFIGMSTLTTFTVWRMVDKDIGAGQRKGQSPYSSAREDGLARGLRNLMAQDISDIFAVQPDTNLYDLLREKDRLIAELMRDRGRGNLSDDAAEGKSLKETWDEERIICPEFDIPGLVGRRKLDLDDLTMSDAIKLVLGESAHNVDEAVQKANDILNRELMNGVGRVAKEGDRRFDTSFQSQSLKIGNYRYLPGGHWKPASCIPRWKVAIVIPFRDRHYHLPIVLRYLIPMLQRQLLEFSIFAIEQANQELFNRAMLMNVGFLEALNFTDYDCFIFHDVDHIPLDDHNYYGCSGMPRHFLSGADRWNYKLPYKSFFGAVSGLTAGQIRQINGFPNVYWGWGGEDDEIWNRLKETNLPVSRPAGPVGHYNVIKHHHKSAPQAKDRHVLLDAFRTRYKKDGLSDIVYPVPTYTLNMLYTNVSVDIQKIKPHYHMPSSQKKIKKEHLKVEGKTPKNSSLPAP